MHRDNSVVNLDVVIIPKISVVIPTRERADTLRYCLETVVAQDYGNFEIIVSDNNSCDNTEEIVRRFNDSRIIYINTGQRLGMSQNWEFALSHVNGDWVTILGDDDALLPDSLSRVSKIITETKVLAVRSAVCSYKWPGCQNFENGRLVVPLGAGFELRDTKSWMSKVLKGCADYLSLPMLYNGGFVDYSLIRRVMEINNGDFYLSSIPDVYSAFAFSSIIDSYVYLNDPLVINGASRHSGGTSFFSGGATFVGSPAHQFASENNIPFHSDIPICADGSFPPSLQAIVYESYLQTRNLRNESVGIDYKEWLTIILAKSGKFEASVQEWGRLFASIHGINFELIQPAVNRKIVVLRWLSIVAQIKHSINSRVIENSKDRISDVYMASVVASSIRQNKPNRLRLILNFIYRQVSKCSLWRVYSGLFKRG